MFNKDFIIGALLGAGVIWAINNPEKVEKLKKEVEEKLDGIIPHKNVQESSQDSEPPKKSRLF